MIVCHCKVVTDRQVVECIEHGARSLGQICRSSGVGQDCGGCVFSVKRLLCEYEASVVAEPVPEVASAAS
jgi:bacterioferritin-associated ferredoxin